MKNYTVAAEKEILFPYSLSISLDSSCAYERQRRKKEEEKREWNGSTPAELAGGGHRSCGYHKEFQIHLSSSLFRSCHRSSFYSLFPDAIFFIVPLALSPISRWMIKGCNMRDSDLPWLSGRPIISEDLITMGRERRSSRYIGPSSSYVEKRWTKSRRCRRDSGYKNVYGTTKKKWNRPYPKTFGL